MLLSRCAPRGAYDLGVLLKKWTQSSVLVLGSETAFLLYYRCDWDSVLWLVVLWQRNHDSQLPLTQRVLTSQGRALTLVLICPCQPHRLLRDETILIISNIVEKLKLSMGLILTFFLSLFISQTAADDPFTCLTFNGSCISAAVKMLWPHCNIYEFPLSLDWWCDHKHPCQIVVQKNHMLRIRKGSTLVSWLE